jgi:hypothetical protein
MPRAVYIFCANMVIEDKETGLASALQIVDKLQTVSIPVEQTPPGQAIAFLWPGLAVLGAWLAEPTDNTGDEYDLEIRFILPGGGQTQDLAKTTFKIGVPDPTKPLFRFVVRFASPPQITTPGTMFVESRIRKTGTQDDWKSQSAPILVEVLPPPAHG